MKFKFFITLSLSLLLVTQSFASKEDQSLLEDFHRYGMTKCDKTILKHASLDKLPNWHLNIEKPSRSVGKGYSSVTLIETFGTKGDTAERDLTFLQTPTSCILSKRLTTTFNGPCKKNIDFNYWYEYKKMPELDYTEYRNAGDVSLRAKEITLGNFKGCIHEYRMISIDNLG